MQNKEITDRILHLIQKTGVSKTDVHTKCNIPQRTFYRNLKCLSDWKLEHLNSIASYFKVRNDWLIYGRGDEKAENSTDEIKSNSSVSKVSKEKDVPIYSYVYGGVAASRWDSNEVFKHVPSEIKGNDIFGVIVAGDSMSPYINNGDVLLCVDNPNLIKNKTAVVVVLKEMETVQASAKLISHDKKNKTITLYSINAKYEPVIYKESEILKIYKVVEIRRKVN